VVAPSPLTERGFTERRGGLLRFKTALQRRIDATDRQIDRLVYELGVYPAESRRIAGAGGRLTEEEAILEGD